MGGRRICGSSSRAPPAPQVNKHPWVRTRGGGTARSSPTPRRDRSSGSTPGTAPKPTSRTRSRNSNPWGRETAHRQPRPQRRLVAVGCSRGHPDRVATPPRDRRRPRPGGTEDSPVPPLRSARPARPTRPPPHPEDPHGLGLGRRPRRRLDPPAGSTPQLTTTPPPRRQREDRTAGRGTGSPTGPTGHTAIPTHRPPPHRRHRTAGHAPTPPP